MTYNFTVSPDFSNKQLAGWFVLNTWIQQALDLPVHCEMYDSFDSQRSASADGKVDLIYANPYDAATLVREHGFLPVVKPVGKADEALIAVAAESGYQSVEDFQPGLRIATTADPDVHMMGMIMIEPADLTSDNVELDKRDSYVLVAKQLMRGDADAGFFLADSYHELSGMVRDGLRVVVQSDIQLIHHLFLVGPSLAERLGDIQDSLVSMADSAKGKLLLEDIGIAGWEPLAQEEVEFMIDLMDTLV